MEDGKRESPPPLCLPACLPLQFVYASTSIHIHPLVARDWTRLDWSVSCVPGLSCNWGGKAMDPSIHATRRDRTGREGKRGHAQSHLAPPRRCRLPPALPGPCLPASISINPRRTTRKDGRERTIHSFIHGLSACLTLPGESQSRFNNTCKTLSLHLFQFAHPKSMHVPFSYQVPFIHALHSTHWN